MSAPTLNYDILAGAVRGGAAALRARTTLQPIGGPGDKVFPPTFGDPIKVKLGDETHTTKYAIEHRRIDGQRVPCVLLDSVASQANRMEEALQRAWDEGRVRFPMVRVDFTACTDDDPALDLSTLGGDGYITALEAPHRLADALLRDSILGDLRWRASEPGRRFNEAGPHDAAAVYALCPTALVFGMWDSTGPKGGLGAKFQRALVSEVVGIGVELGRKTSSRIDPAGIQTNAGLVYEAKDPAEEWTLVEAEAKPDKKGNPTKFSRTGNDKAGKPSSINHANVKPSIESEAGGVTMDYALQTTVLSVPALRRLRFPKNVSGEAIPGDRQAAAREAATTALAALALAGVALQRDEGFDLRSRSALLPDRPLAFEILGRDGSVEGPFALPVDAALALVEKAASVAAEHGMGWSSDPITLTPAPKLVDLIRESRRVAAAADDAEDAN